MKLVLTIDVEEEGLFRGRYPAGNAPTENVSRLQMLGSLFSSLRIRPTLLVTYAVACSPGCRHLLLNLQEAWGAEIGAHLHPWNTPPIEPQPFPEPVPSERMAKGVLKAKLDTLLETIGEMGSRPFSFRMGRFNLGPGMLALLQETALRVDSSVAPGREFYGGPSHLTAPNDPYFPDPGDVCAARRGGILEVPITIVPIVKWAGSLVKAFGRGRLAATSKMSILLQHLLFLPAQPAWTGLRRLKAAARLHQQRGGRVLTVFFHSSELMPGAYPGHKTEDDVRRFLLRLEQFVSWLDEDIGVEPVTLSEVWDLYAR